MLGDNNCGLTVVAIGRCIGPYIEQHFQLEIDRNFR